MSDLEQTNKALAERDAKTGRFVTGNVGGPGRKPGSRNKLGEAFVADLYADWREHGPKVIAEARESDPVAYLKVVASILPKMFEFEHSVDLASLQTADEIVAQVRCEMGDRAAEMLMTLLEADDDVLARITQETDGN
jgi:hypothetical protein